MARKPKKPVAKKAPARSAPTKRPAAAAPVEHRIVAASVGVVVVGGPTRSEYFELRGAAVANASLADGGARTTGLVQIMRKKGAKGGDSVAYDPASLNRALVFTLLLGDEDFALFRDVFVRNPGGYDPGFRLWARTARPIDMTAVAGQPVIAFGYSLDLVHTPGGQR